MIKFVYILFFGLINFLFFAQFTKKVMLNLTTKIVILGVLLLFIGIHYWNPIGKSIPNKLFVILLVFSCGLFIFYIMPKIAVWFMKTVNNIEDDHLLFKGFSIVTDYVIYILIYVFQCATIIKNT